MIPQLAIGKGNRLGKIASERDDGMLTPKWLFEQLDAVFKFDLDAACTSYNCLCDYGFYFDEGTNALEIGWGFNRVFCNPPFSGKAAWMKKAHHEVQNNSCPIVVMLLPTNSMDSKPWHQFVYPHYKFDILEGRVSFLDPVTMLPKKGNNSGTTVVYFMKKPKRPV